VPINIRNITGTREFDRDIRLKEVGPETKETFRFFWFAGSRVIEFTKVKEVIGLTTVVVILIGPSTLLYSLIITPALEAVAVKAIAELTRSCLMFIWVPF
jgi:hypothetical protein